MLYKLQSQLYNSNFTTLKAKSYLDFMYLLSLFDDWV